MLETNDSQINCTQVHQFTHAKNKFLLSSGVGHIGVVEVDRIINDQKLSMIKQERWEKDAFGFALTLQKELFYAVVNDLQMSFGSKKKISFEDITEGLSGKECYEKLFLSLLQPCLNKPISTIGSNYRKLVFFNSSPNTVSLIKLCNKQHHNKIDTGEGKIIKSDFLSYFDNHVITLKNDTELTFHISNYDIYTVSKRLFNVINYFSVTIKERESLLVLFFDGRVELYHK